MLGLIKNEMLQIAMSIPSMLQKTQIEKYFLTNIEVEIFSVRRRKYFKESALTDRVQSTTKYFRKYNFEF